jgi:hypothetical protein
MVPRWPQVNHWIRKPGRTPHSVGLTLPSPCGPREARLRALALEARPPSKPNRRLRSIQPPFAEASGNLVVPMLANDRTPLPRACTATAEDHAALSAYTEGARSREITFRNRAAEQRQVDDGNRDRLPKRITTVGPAATDLLTSPPPLSSASRKMDCRRVANFPH